MWKITECHNELVEAGTWLRRRANHVTHRVCCVGRSTAISEVRTVGKRIDIYEILHIGVNAHIGQTSRGVTQESYPKLTTQEPTPPGFGEGRS